MKPTKNNTELTILKKIGSIIFLVILVFSFVNQEVEQQAKMPRKRGTPSRDSTRRGGARWKVNFGATNGYVS